VAVLAYLILPIAVVVVLSFISGRLLEFPPPGLSLKWYRGLLADPELLDSLSLSLWIAAWSSTIALVTGTGAAYALTRHAFRGRALVHSLFVAPLVVPYIALALGLSPEFSLLRMRGTPASIILAHTVIVLPFVVLLVGPGFAMGNRTLEEAAVTLGANRVVTFVRITVPLIKRNLIAAWVFAFIVSFDDFILAYFLSGPFSVTLPVKMYAALRERVDPAISAVSTLTVFVAVAGTLVYAQSGEWIRRARGDTR